MSNINALALASVTGTNGSDEDLSIAFAYTINGAPIDLTGIRFKATLAGPASTIVLSTDGGQISIGGAGSNIVSIFVPVGSKASWGGAYRFEMVATDGVFTRTVIANSQLTVLAFGGSSFSATIIQPVSAAIMDIVAGLGPRATPAPAPADAPSMLGLGLSLNAGGVVGAGGLSQEGALDQGQGQDSSSSPAPAPQSPDTLGLGLSLDDGAVPGAGGLSPNGGL